MCGPGPATFLGLVLLPAGPSRHSCVPRSARCLGRAQPPGGTAAPRASRPAPRLTPGSGSALGPRFCPGPARLPPASAPTQVPHRSAAKKPRAEGGCGVLPLAQPQDWGGGGASDAQGAEQGTPWGPRSSPDARAEPAGSSAPGSSPGGARPPRSLGLGSRSELQGEWCPPRRSRLAPGQPRVAELGSQERLALAGASFGSTVCFHVETQQCTCRTVQPGRACTRACTCAVLGIASPRGARPSLQQRLWGRCWAHPEAPRARGCP